MEIGSSLANSIAGKGAKKLLAASSGNDSLSGGSGLDVFRFNTSLSATATCR